MPRRLAAAAAGTDQPPATAAKIKTASHTNFLTLPKIFPKPLRGLSALRGGRLLICCEYPHSVQQGFPQGSYVPHVPYVVEGS